jgi:hypothetical protein
MPSRPPYVIYSAGPRTRLSRESAKSLTRYCPTRRARAPVFE